MSSPVAVQCAQKYPADLGMIKEREFYKYLPPYHLNAHALQHIGPVNPPKEYVARSSVDPVLTAFAQLGALRLDAQRAIISLFGRREQHILTEATRTLSLQNDADHNSHDELWVGSCTISYDRSLCKSVLRPTPNATHARDRVIAVPDVTQDDAFKDHPDVTSFPNIRFFASSPIISPKGIVIGAYTILDDKPHEPLDTSLLNFLADVSATVMDYLETSRSKGQHLRSERMIVGLGSFLEGKGSLRSSWVLDADSTRSVDEKNHAEGHVNQEQQEKQLSDDIARAAVQTNTTSHLPFHPYKLHIPRSPISQPEKEQDLPPLKSTNTRRDAKAEHKFREASRAAMASDNDHSPKDDYTAKVRQTFSRASNLIRESIEVEAVVFFDASFNSQEAFVNSGKSDPESSCFESCSSGDESKSRGSGSGADQDSLDPELAQISGKATLNPCDILGFSTSRASSVNDQLKDDTKIALSESFLRGLLHRYPRGKIFNFGENGIISSDDTSDGVFKQFFRRNGGKKYKKTQRSLIRQDAQALLQLAPESRSIVFTPLWDSHKGRWYSGALTWTTASHRVFTSNDELAFLLTFGNSVMAEVHRLGSHFADRAKSDLLSGLSHELRSPLHGIFGTTELMNDTVMDALQRGFVHTIASCAFTLLGSINQLLEYASINDVRPSSVVKTPGGSVLDKSTNQKLTATHHLSHPGKVDFDTYVELDSAVEDAVETVFAGYSFLSSSRSPLRGIAGYPISGARHLDPRSGVKVVMDIDYAHSWKFSTRPGAWHVILTNIFGNALKFTQKGYIHISMTALPAKFGNDGEVIKSTVTVTIKDTGSGIDQDYLNNGLYTAFSQEDSMTTGNGLGFNITQRTVQSLGGTIHVNSKKHVGTEVVISVTLDHASEQDVRDHLDIHAPITTIRELTNLKTIGILGLGTSDLDRAQYTALRKLCQDWFSMDVCLVMPSQTQFDHCDFYISPHEHLDIGNLEIQAIAPSPKERFPSPVIIICSSPRIAHSLFIGARKRKDADVLEFISQPCGPRKLAETLETCIRRQQQRLGDISYKNSIRDGPGGLSTANVMNALLSPREGLPSFAARDDPIASARLPTMLDPMKFTEEHADGPPAPLGDIATELQDTHPKPENNPVSDLPTTILLVDDNEINLRLLIAFMKKLKCDYAIAQNGEEALEVFRANYSLIGMIIMDISMPVMDGLESTRRIREFEKEIGSKSRTMIVALTGVAHADMQRDATGCGMDMFLTKPVRLSSLVPIIQGIFPSTHAICQDRK
ncbi:CheY-like superfamily [Penicillium bovifimosum]|uniref:CheY-like superfamily n=1 Tax=Penicillium bovifimosum TaxID=126998 RepID=A0A9W9H128_9EURO|nr:CheY-like superfamily [Penicillium bovifimosum]KAJ5135671.1 CheY-like superfamily [Penicillium bovifimosum]